MGCLPGPKPGSSPVPYRPFSLDHLDDYQKHFTVMNYAEGVQLKQVTGSRTHLQQQQRHHHQQPQLQHQQQSSAAWLILQHELTLHHCIVGQRRDNKATPLAK